MTNQFSKLNFFLTRKSAIAMYFVPLTYLTLVVATDCGWEWEMTIGTYNEDDAP